MTDTRAQLAALEAGMAEGDELMARVIEDLRGLLDETDELEDLERRRSVMRAAAASFVWEASSILREQNAQPSFALFGCVPAPAYHQ